MDAKLRPRNGFAAEKQRRLCAAKLFRAGWYPAGVAQRLGVTRQAASQWFTRWKAHGESGLQGAERPGPPSKLSPKQLEEVDALLLQGPQAHGYTTAMWTLRRIAKVVRKRFRVKLHPGHVWRLLGKLGWSCQRPERRARERNDKAIRRWLRCEWPRIKKMPNANEHC
jgi:transposase